MDRDSAPLGRDSAGSTPRLPPPEARKSLRPLHTRQSSCHGVNFPWRLLPVFARLPSAPCLAMAQHQLRTHPPQHTTCTGCNDLLDHLVGAAGKGQWNGDAERLGGLEIDVKLDFGYLLDR